MTSFETQIEIEQPREDVFRVVADPTTYPSWNSAVTSVRPSDGSGTRFRMERDLPTGRAENALEVVDSTPPSDVVVRAAQGPTPFLYRYALTQSGGTTTLRLDAEVDLGAIGTFLGPLAAHTVKRGVDANFETLKAMLER